MTAAEAIHEDPAEFLVYARLDWLVAKSWRRLHYAEIPERYWPGIAEEWAVLEPIRLACGRTAGGLWIPGICTRDPDCGAPRCSGCCRATGMPFGTGSPKNSAECRKILGLNTP